MIENLAMHAKKNGDCNQTYTQDQIFDLKDLSKEVSKAKKRIPLFLSYLTESIQKCSYNHSSLLDSLYRRQKDC